MVERIEKYEHIRNGIVSVYLDFGIYAGSRQFSVLSIFDRSEQSVRSVCAALTEGKGIAFRNEQFCVNVPYDCFTQIVTKGKSRVCHAVCISKEINNKLILTTEEHKSENIYNFLMKTYSLPLQREWAGEIVKALENKMFSKTLCRGFSAVTCGKDSDLGQRYIYYKDKIYSIADLSTYMIEYNSELLNREISNLLATKKLRITDQSMNALSFGSQDEYFKKYGSSLVKNLRKLTKPEMEIEGETQLVFNNKRLYPQQIAIGLASANHLINNHSIMVNGKMGVGKTLIGLFIIESYFINKALRAGLIKDIKDAYRNNNIISYRILVMCPGHLTSKWAEEIVKEVPLAKATIINSFDTLVEMEKKGPARNGREYFVVSKDFLKLGYQEKPVPKKVIYKPVSLRKCSKCGNNVRGRKCGYCDEDTEIKIEKTHFKAEGLTCPFCKELIFTYGDKIDELVSGDADLSKVAPLQPIDFKGKTSSNESCIYCGERLWEPHVENKKLDFVFDKGVKEKDWYRATYYKDKSKNGKITCWVLKGYESDYSMYYGKQINEVKRENGLRKYPPSIFIKKKMKGFFDIAVVDEVHTCKAGGSAQGASMQHVINSAKKAICLTGTLTGGKASDLFYLFWRLYPRMMKNELHYTWNSMMDFCDQFGVVEREFECLGNNRASAYNVSSRGRQITQASVKPGISPALLIRILDKTVFLDISDLSSHLPKFSEKVVISDINLNGNEEEREMLIDYYSTSSRLGEMARKKDSGGLLGAKTSYELSFLDKPYGAKDIVHPVFGDVVVRHNDYSHLVLNGKMLTKESDLIDIIKQEQSENRNCVVYAHFTGKEETNVTTRLKEIICRECDMKDNEVIILKSSSPAAEKREAWMHQKAELGMKVMICNPKCVETGRALASAA